MASDTDFEDLLSAATGQTITPGRRRMSVVERVLWLLASIPTISLGLLLTLALRVRLADGAWPIRNQPDPKTLGFHNTLTIIGFLASFVVVVIVPLITLAAFALGQRRTSIRPVILTALGCLALFLVLRLDLGGLGDWIAD